ncbi:MAG: BrnT family toxin [Oscillospiraceae bacterium]|nr:BrnT family toxin [Oscillospiraceae bacterium]
MPIRDSLEFEWDEEKAAANLKKHGVDFWDAIRVFDDEDRIEYYDYAHSDEEDRFNTIGLVKDVLFVVYTERRDAIRIISARYANSAERRLYYDR